VAVGSLQAEEITIGQRVVVVRDRASILAGAQPVDIVDQGDVLTVANVNADFVLVGRGHSGWLNRAAVVPLDSGLAHFNRIVEQNPHDLGARAARAAMWVEARDWDAAIAEATEALRQNPRSIHALLVRSAAQRGKKIFDGAKADAQTAIRLAPAFPWGFVAAGDAWRDQGRFDHAILDYTAALERDPANPHILLRRGQARLATSQPDQWQQALVDLRQGIGLSDNDPACQRQCQLARGHVYIKQQDTSRALVEFADVLNRNSDDVEALIGRGTAYGYNRQYQEALRALDEAVYLAPKSPLTYIARADVRTRQYNTRGATRDLDEAQKLDPKSATLLRIRGEALIKQRKLDLALEAFDQAVAIEPNNTTILLARAIAYDAKKDGARAAIDRQRATEIKASEMLPPAIAVPGGAAASVAGTDPGRR
jgi:tetratricopeptide (TPR) repeat protein